jgi:molybdate-binding protein/DNA-binding XRE family transcriptional regulator
VSTKPKNQTLSDPSIENRLRLRRQSLGLSQSALAGSAGVTRQALCAVEAGRYFPATPVALRLAKALQCRVEDLFSLKQEQELIEAEFVGPPMENHAGARVKLIRIADRVLAKPVMSLGGFLNFAVRADGFVVDRESVGDKIKVRMLRDWSSVSRQIVVAGCDPAMFLMAEHLRYRLKDDGLVIQLVSSEAAVNALKRGEAHVAGLHMVDERSRENNLPYLRRHLRGMDVQVVTFASWEEGLIVAGGNPKNIRCVTDLARRDVVLINREMGSGARQLLDRQLVTAGLQSEKIRGYDRRVSSHLEVAWLVKERLADVGIGARSAAMAFGLDFIPIRQERYDLVIPKVHLDSQPALSNLLDTMVSRPFRAELEALHGYDTRETGRVVELGPC